MGNDPQHKERQRQDHEARQRQQRESGEGRIGPDSDPEEITSGEGWSPARDRKGSPDAIFTDRDPLAPQHRRGRPVRDPGSGSRALAP
jgi:hypothetical protein